MLKLLLNSGSVNGIQVSRLLETGWVSPAIDQCFYEVSECNMHAD